MNDEDIKKKDILILMGEIPFPVFKGNQNRIYEFIKIFVNLGHNVHLGILNSNQKERKSIDIEKDLRNVLPSLKTIVVRRHPNLKKNKIYNIKKKIFNISSKNDISNIETVPPNFKDAIKKQIININPDILFVNYLKLSNAIPTSFKGKLVCDLHDIQCDITKEAIKLNVYKKKIDIDKFCLSELKLMEKYDTLIAINPNEAKKISLNIKKQIELITIPAFMQLPKISITEFKYDVMFVGSASPFNVDAAMKFIAKCMPYLRKKHVNIKFAIAGDVSKSSAVSKVKNNDVIKLGRVDDLSQLYSQSKIVICPLRGGAGMKIKVIEALTFGKPIVTTNVGADGIIIKDGVNGFIADDYQSFSEKVSLLLGDNKLREEFEKNARLTAVKYYQPDSVISQLQKITDNYDDYYSNKSSFTFPTINKEIHFNQKKKRILIFSMEARSLMEYALDFGKKVSLLGFEPIFIKVENSYFNVFQEYGFKVISIKDYFKKIKQNEIDKTIKKSNIDYKNLENISYYGIDFSEDIQIHKMMFPLHFEGNKQISSVKYAFKILITIDKIINQVAPQSILGWNGNGPHLIYLLKVLAKKNDMPILQMERGLLPKSYLVDPQGVNFKSFFSGSFLPLITEKEEKESSRYIDSFKNNMETIVGKKEKKEKKEEIYKKLDMSEKENYIFFPQQIEGDSNIIINSNRYKKMDEVLSDLLKVGEQLNLKVVTRLHPENMCISEVKKHRSLIVNNEIHLHSLLKYSIVNVVINSTVGLESILFDRPTIALGKAIYTDKELTYDVNSYDGILQTINDIKMNNIKKIDKKKTLRFVSFLINEYLIFIDEKGISKSTQNILKRVGFNDFKITKQIKKVNGLSFSNDIDNKNILLLDFLGMNSKRYYTGPNRPEISINHFIDCYSNLFDKNITILTTNKNLNIKKNIQITCFKINDDSIKERIHKICINAHNQIKTNDYIIIIIHQDHRDWMPFIEKHVQNNKVVFIDEYFLPYSEKEQL